MKKNNKFSLSKIYNFSHIFGFLIVGILVFSLIPSGIGIKSLDQTIVDESNVDHKCLHPNANAVPQAASNSILNATIQMNQTAYLPNSFANITLKINNNFSSPIQSLSMNISSLSDLKLISGNLNNVLSQLEVNQNFSRNIICQIPESSQSIDVVFLIDGSGSMGEEILEVKGKVQNLINSLYSNITNVRIGVIFFGNTQYAENPYDDERDILDFTSDTDQIQNFLDPWAANGGWEPWGDALRYLKQLSWQSSARLAILITDEPCNNGYYIGDGEGDSSYYDGPELFDLAEELHELGIVVSTMQCFGGGELLESQLSKIASITLGSFVKLSSSSDELMTHALEMCYEVLQESGQKISVIFSASINSTIETIEKSKWIVVDNNPPGLTGNIIKILDTSKKIPNFRFRVICEVYDAAGVVNVSLFYKFNTTNFIHVYMNYSRWATFTYLLPEIPENSVIKYYFQAEDVLHNLAETEISEFVAEYSVTELEMPYCEKFVLGINESVLYKIDLSKLNAEVKFLISSDTGVYGESTFSNSSYSENWTITSDSRFKLLRLLPVEDILYLSLLNMDGYSDATIKIMGNDVHNFTIDGKTQKIHLSQTSPLMLYKVTVNVNINQSFYVNTTMSNGGEAQFLDMIVFNETNLFKSQIFTKISVSVNSSGDYYILLGLLDDRVDEVDILVDIAYGSINDEPYWSIAGLPNENAPIPGYYLIFLFAFMGIVVVIIKKKRQL
ncbi:MAG: vWA domain-containing protein [Promethearchaeota archaeon]